jgi:hypothetical protein
MAGVHGKESPDTMTGSEGEEEEEAGVLILLSGACPKTSR